jgi:hypothetical protein
MDLDWLIVIARALMIGGAAAVLIGLVTMARPIAAIGLGNRKRAGLAGTGGSLPSLWRRCAVEPLLRSNNSMQPLLRQSPTACHRSACLRASGDASREVGRDGPH